MDTKRVKVLPVGTRVRVTNVDMYGHRGRDHHPLAGHVGWEGTIVARDVHVYDEDLAVVDTPNLSDCDTVVDCRPDEHVEVWYLVTKRHNDDSMTMLELMDSEIREVTEDELAKRRFALKLIARQLNLALDALGDLEVEGHEFYSSWVASLASLLEEAHRFRCLADKNF